MNFDWLKREKWAHVKTFTLTGLAYGPSNEPEKKKGGKLFIHFFESSKGNRKVKNACSFTEANQDQIDSYAESTEEYQKRIVRWLAGRLDPEIPKYSQISEEDTANALRGKIE